MLARTVQARYQIRSGPRPTEGAGYPVVVDAEISTEVLGQPSDARYAFVSELRGALSHVDVQVDQIGSTSGLAPVRLVMPDYGVY